MAEKKINDSYSNISDPKHASVKIDLKQNVAAMVIPGFGICAAVKSCHVLALEISQAV